MVVRIIGNGRVVHDYITDIVAIFVGHVVHGYFITHLRMPIGFN